MSSIHYRPIQEKDFPAVSEIINQAFDLFDYVPNFEVLDAFKLQYLYSCLSESTYTCVAEQDGTVVGVIMGNTKNDYRIAAHLRHTANTLRYSLKMRRMFRKERAGTQDYDALHKIYREFSNKHRGEFDGVLTLFAVNRDCRGFGVGTALWDGLQEYLRCQGVKRIYLYTDTTCNYGFYERHGFHRLEAQTMTMTKGGAPFHLDVFLYGYAFL